MIQRIQTVYLALAILALTLLFFFPMATFISDLAYLKFYLLGLKNMAPDGITPVPATFNIPLIIVVVLIIALDAVAIFLFKNRSRQIQLTNIAVMLNILFILGILFIYIPMVEKKTSIKPDFTSGLGIYLPIVSLMFTVLSNRAIKRDDKLVRSSDRLR